MEVAELTAQLRAEVAAFRANLASADASLAATRGQLRDLEKQSAEATATLGRVKVTAGQAAETKGALDTMQRSVSGVTDAAMRASHQLGEVKLKASAAAETVANAEIEKRALKDLEDQAIKTRIAAGGGGIGGLLRGALPGGQRASAGFVTSAIGLGIAASPAVGAGAAGLAVGASFGLEALAGSIGVLKLAFDGLSAKAFTDQKAFDALPPAQQHLVQTLRSLDAGLMKNLRGIAQGIVIPGITSALGAAITPASVNTLTQAVTAFSRAISVAAQAWGHLLGSAGFNRAFSAVLQASATYAQHFGVELMHLFDAFVHLQQAAIPFTNWLDRGVLGFSKWVDGATKSAQASGQLTKFFEGARKGLESFGGLLGSVAKLLGAVLGAVGLQNSIGTLNLVGRAINMITKLLNDNRDVFRDFFAGALAAAGDILTLIGGILKALTPLLHLLNDIAGAVGGWKVVFEAAAVYFTATMIPGMFKSLAMLIFSVGTALPAAAATGAETAAVAIEGIGIAASAALGPVMVLAAALYGLGKLAVWAAHAGDVDAGGMQPGPPGTGGIIGIPGTAGGGVHKGVRGGPMGVVGASGASATPALGSFFGTPPGIQGRRVPGATTGSSFNPYGTPGALATTGGGGAATKHNQQVTEAVRAALAALDPGSHLGLTKSDMAAIWNEVLAARGQHAQAILGIAGAAPGMQGLANSLDGIKKLLAAHPILDTAVVKAQIKKFNEALALGTLDSGTRSAIQHALSALKSDLTTKLKEAAAAAKAQAKEIADAAREAVQGAMQALNQAVQQIVAAGDAAFDRQTASAVRAMQDALALEMQARADALTATVKGMSNKLAADLKNMQIMVTSSAGSFMFGGSITETPAEAALRAMQEAHDAQQRQMELTQAQQSLITANATGDPQQIADARQRLRDVQYAIDVAAISKDADTQRKAADDQLQQARDTYQEQEQVRIDAYQRQQQDANTAYERMRSDAIAAYEQQRTLQRTAMDNQIAEYVALMGQYPNETSKYLNLILGVFNDNGLQSDLNSSAMVVGGKIYSGLAAGLDPIYGMINDLMYRLAQLAQAESDAGVPPTFPGGGGGGGGGGSCFVAGTLVETPNGQVAIENLQPGAHVLCWDFDLYRPVPTTIAFVDRHEGAEESEVVEVQSESGHTIIGTEEHLVWTGHLWTRLGDAASLWRPGVGGTSVAARQTLPGTRAVYNIHVHHRSHNYFANGFLVHNVKESGGATGAIVTSKQKLWVGEKGPEAIIPMSSLGKGLAGLGGGEGVAEIHTHVYLDGREITEVVRKHLLRRGKQQSSIFGGLA